MPKADGYHRVVVKFKSRVESKTECMDPGSVATVRTTRLWPHLKQSNSRVAWAGSFRNAALRT